MYENIIEKEFGLRADKQLIASLTRLTEKFSAAGFGTLLAEERILSLLRYYSGLRPRLLMPFMINPYDHFMVIGINGPVIEHISEFHPYDDQILFEPIYQDCGDYFNTAKSCNFDQLCLDDAHTFPLTPDAPQSPVNVEKNNGTLKSIAEFLKQELHPEYAQYLKICLIWLSPRNDSSAALKYLTDQDPEVADRALNVLSRRGSLSALKRIVQIVKESKKSTQIQSSNLDYDALLALNYLYPDKQNRGRDYFLKRISQKYKEYLRYDNWQIADLFRWTDEKES